MWLAAPTRVRGIDDVNKELSCVVDVSSSRLQGRKIQQSIVRVEEGGCMCRLT